MALLFNYEYLGPKILAGFDSYKYSSKDTSPLSQYVMHPFWNQVVRLCPMWVAPNLLTFVGFLCCIGHFLLLTIFDYSFTAGTAPPEISGQPEVAGGSPVPSGVWAAVALLLFLSHTLDGIDGKQARRTGSSTPLGELFDHGLDSWATIFITGSVYSIFGRNLDLYSISPFRMFCVLWNVYFCFLISHWEKYNTGVLYLPWGYDLSMVTGFLLYIASAIGGQGMFKVKFPGGVYPGPVLETLVYLGNVGLTLPIALRNIYRSYRDGTGKKRTFVEAMRPMVSTTVAMALCFLWILNSPHNILEQDPRCCFYLTGTVFAYICCKLIIAQMSNTRCELFSVILIPLGVAVFVAILANLTLTGELAVLYTLTGVVTLCHVHYGICVVREMCRHFKIRPFHISPTPPPPAAPLAEDSQRLLDSDDESDIPLRSLP